MGFGILLDLVMLAIVVICAFVSARRGFVRTAIELVGWFLVLYLALTFSQPIAEGVYENFVYEPMSAKTEEIVADSIADTTGNAAENLWDKLPGYITSAVETFGIDRDSVNDSFDSAVIGGTEAVTSQVMRSIVGPVITAVIRWIVVALIFAIGMTIVRCLAIWLNRMLNFSIVGNINRGLGGILGILKGVLVSFLIYLILMIIISAQPDGVGFVTKDFLSTSFVYSFFDKINPFMK